MPIRIQRQRTKGWKMPPNTVYVGRPTVWGNPYWYGSDQTAAILRPKFKCSDAAHAVAMYEARIQSPEYAVRLRAAQEELRGKNLACWCDLGQPCHADLLLKWANPVKMIGQDDTQNDRKET